jgi:hypothetical protein
MPRLRASTLSTLPAFSTSAGRFASSSARQKAITRL